MISTTPADTPAAGDTPARSITMSGTWFARVGMRPYELLGLIDRTPGTRTPVRTLPLMDIAA